MSAIVNPRDILMQAAPSRLNPVTLPPNVVIPELVPDPAAPVVPTGFAVSAAISHIFIEHDSPTFTVGHGYARTNVYGAIWPGVPTALPVFANAVKITSFSGQVFAHATNPALVWHLWITWQSRDGGESTPAGGPNGLVATTGQDVSSLVAAMTGPGNPFTVLAVDTVIDGVTYPAGTYSTRAFIENLQVTNAKIANLAVDDAKIASLAVSKLLAGSIAVAQYIQSTGFIAGSIGWRIKGDGTAELSEVVIRGTVYAMGGEIGGNLIDAEGMESPGYVAGSTGWRLASSGLLRAFAAGGTRLIDMAATGTSPVLKFGAALEILANGTATYGGALSAATGTFSGSLTADAISAVSTINIAGNAVSVQASASGSTETISTNLWVPADETMELGAFLSCDGYGASAALYIDDVLVGSAYGVTTYEYVGTEETGSLQPSGSRPGLTMAARSVSGGAFGRSVPISAVTTSGMLVATKIVLVQGRLR